MKIILLAAFCLAVIGASASQRQQQLQQDWLPRDDGLQPCTWCSDRYYRRLPQRGNDGVGQINDNNDGGRNTGCDNTTKSGRFDLDFGRKAGWFYDVIPQQPVKSERSACIEFVGKFNTEQKGGDGGGPVLASQIIEKINKIFFGDHGSVQHRKDYSDKPHPFAFQCCHYKFGRSLNKDNTNEEQGLPQESTTETVELVDDNQGDKSSSTTTNENVTVRAGGRKQNTALEPKKIGDELRVNQGNKTVRRKTREVDNKQPVNVVDNNPNKITGRTNLRGAGVSTNIDVVGSSDGGRVGGVQEQGVEEFDEYKASKPQGLPTGYDCNSLTRRLYKELSQPVVQRKNVIQRAVQEKEKRQRDGGVGGGSGEKQGNRSLKGGHSENRSANLDKP